MINELLDPTLIPTHPVKHGVFQQSGDPSTGAAFVQILDSDGNNPLSTTNYKETAVTRPANATPYTAGDVKGGATTGWFEITGLGAANEVVRITAAKILINVAAVPSGMTYMTLYLYNTQPPSGLADNAPWTGTGDSVVFEDSIVFGNMAVFGAYLRAKVSDLAVDVKLSATGSIFCYLVTAGAFTPTSGAITTTGLFTVGG